MTSINERLLSTAMTANLDADLRGVVPRALIADMLRAVLDEKRQTVPRAVAAADR